MAVGNREAAAAKLSPAAATRGRLSERAWADVRRAARLAREEGVAVKVHGIEVYGLPLKQHKQTPCSLGHQVQKKPAEPAEPTLPSATAGDAPPKPLTTRQQRSAQRLQEYQEKKRAAEVQELVVKGCELSVAQAKVARLERKRLEERTMAGAALMEEDAASVDGRPPGEEGQPCGGDASSKRARVSPPETG